MAVLAIAPSIETMHLALTKAVWSPSIARVCNHKILIASHKKSGHLLPDFFIIETRAFVIEARAFVSEIAFPGSNI